MTLVNTDRYLFKRQTNVFVSYSQPSIMNGGQSSSFDLVTGVRTPRMCAVESVEVEEPITYYLNTNPIEYVISKESNYGNVMAEMLSGGSRIVWTRHTGEDASNYFGKFDPYDKSGTITFEATDELLEGVQQTFIRGCSRHN